MLVARSPEAESTLAEVRRVLLDDNERVAIRVQRRKLEYALLDSRLFGLTAEARREVAQIGAGAARQIDNVQRPAVRAPARAGFARAAHNERRSGAR